MFTIRGSRGTVGGGRGPVGYERRDVGAKDWGNYRTLGICSRRHGKDLEYENKLIVCT